MFRTISIAAATLAALAGPLGGAALAQTDQPSATNMHGSPNANGFGKHEGIDKSSPMTGAAGSERSSSGDEPSASKMHGPPNANGYGK